MKQVRRIKFVNDKDSSNFDKLMEMNIWNEFCNLWKAMKALDTLIVFCHNDCNPGNILKLEKNKLMLIDYEYGSYNYRGFDIANSFCEMIFDYNCEEAPFFHAVPELFPNQEMQESFAEAYIERFKEINPAMIAKDSSLASKEKLLKEINHFVLVSHLFWVIWSLRMLPEASTFNFDHLVSNFLLNTCIQNESLIIFLLFKEYGLLRSKLYFKQKKLLFPNGFDNFKE
jgi:choline/ethanolamine kinase